MPMSMLNGLLDVAHTHNQLDSNLITAQCHDFQFSEMELMADRFAKLLLGEDMSGGKKSVSSALALSNAITNLSASILGEMWRLEPLPPERKRRWTKEMGWFLSVVDHIVEFVPSYQRVSDGSIIEVMVTKSRSDLQMNIPALRKLEALLFECMDRFNDTEFWYLDIDMKEYPGTQSERERDKWWIPSPAIPDGGLSEKTRKVLQHERDSVTQILKAALAINSQVLSEMEMPDAYWESFPKNGKAILGDEIYRHITLEHFCPEVALCSLDLSSDHRILDVKNRLEAALALWKKKIDSSKSSRGNEKREVHAERAETLLTLLKFKFPGLPQTVLDITKIQFNKDVGQSVLESYSRVLESLAFNILSRIDRVLHADDEMKIKHHESLPLPLSRTSSASSSFSLPATPCIYSNPNQQHMKTVEELYRIPSTKTLSEFISWEDKQKGDGGQLQGSVGTSKKLSPVRVASNLRRYYWSYIESLEKMGVIHSPPARD